MLIFLACTGVAAMIPRRLIIVAPPTHDHADGVLRMQHGLEGPCCVNHTLRDAMGSVRCGGLANAEQSLFGVVIYSLALLCIKKLSAVLNYLRIPLREVLAFERLKVIVTLSRLFEFTLCLDHYFALSCISFAMARGPFAVLFILVRSPANGLNDEVSVCYV